MRWATARKSDGISITKYQRLFDLIGSHLKVHMRMSWWSYAVILGVYLIYLFIGAGMERIVHPKKCPKKCFEMRPKSARF